MGGTLGTYMESQRHGRDDRLAFLGPEANGVLMSPEEFDAIQDWDELYFYELIRGVVVVSEMRDVAVADMNEHLGHWLRSLDKGDEGLHFDETLPNRYVYLQDGSRRLVDRIVWCGYGRTPRPRIDRPSIVVDFIPRRHRDWIHDYIARSSEYRLAGVREYWLIDRFRRTMAVFFADGSEIVVTESESYESPLLPGFRLALGRLLAVADEWAESDEE